jgi:hypothetical protein
LRNCAKNIVNAVPKLQSLTARIRGQESLLLTLACVDLAITRAAGMLGPVTFFMQK